MKVKPSTLYVRALFLCALLIAPLAAGAQLNLDAQFDPNVSNAPGQGLCSQQLPDGKILVGGDFHLVNGSSRRNLVRVNADGSLDPTFNANGSGPNARVYAIVPVAGNKFLIGGSFLAYNDVFQSGIVRINADGSLDDTFNPGGTGLAGVAQTIEVQGDGRIILSGSNITGYNGAASFSIVRLNIDGTLDTSFQNGFGSGQFVEDIHKTPTGKIFISGSFGSYGGVGVNSVAQLNTDGTLDTAFRGNLGSGPNDAVYGSAVQSDGKIVITGAFTQFNGTPRRFIARLNADGTLDTSFVPNASVGGGSGGEYVLPLLDGKIVVVGDFFCNPIRCGLLRLNSDGSSDITFPVGTIDNLGYSASLQTDSKVIFAGFFTQFGGADRRGYVRLNADGTVDPTFATGTAKFGSVNSVAIQSDNKVLAAGVFTSAGGYAARNIARFNPSGSLDTAFQNAIGSATGTSRNFNNLINAVAVQSDDKILVGGIFGSFNGTPATSLVRLNADGTVDTTFTATGISNLSVTDTNISDIVVLPDGKILVSGTLPNTSSRLAVLNPNGSFNSFTPNGDLTFNGTVQRLVRAQDGKIYVGGSFTTLFGTAHTRLARLNSDLTVDSSFNPAISPNTVFDVLPQDDGKIMATGSFNVVGGQPRNAVARLNGDGTLDTSFTPAGGASATVYSIARQVDGKYYAGGLFNAYNGAPATRLMELNSDGTLDASFVSGVGSDPINFVRRVLFQSDGRLLIGGTYNLYGGFPRGSLVRLSAASVTTPLPPSQTPPPPVVVTAPGFEPGAPPIQAGIQFPNVIGGGTVAVTPIAPTSTGALPQAGFQISSLNIAMEIQSTATFTGSVVVSLKVPQSVTQIEFDKLRIMHGENGTLVDRTILAPDTPAPDYANRTIYARVTSFSPFVVGQLLAPTAARVSISGKVTTADGNGIARTVVRLNGQNGRMLTALTNSFGYYRFDNVQTGASYLMDVAGKRYSFEPRVLTVRDQLTDLDLVALP